MKQPYTDTDKMQLANANLEVNSNVQYTTDIQQYGQEEYWAVAGTRGDCEDYALAKLKMLRDLGWPKETLDIGICELKKSDGTGDPTQGHAVLVAHTSSGDMILDNNNDKVVPWFKAPYKWIEMSVNGDFKNWVAIG